MLSAIHLPLSAVFFAILGAALFLAAPSQAVAIGEGHVYVSPPSTVVPSGSLVPVSVIVEPPNESLAIWIIEVHYDPSVVQLNRLPDSSADCSTFPPPGGAVATAAGCDSRDDVPGGGDDVAVAFGGWIENTGSGAIGITTPMSVATFNFYVHGAAFDFTDLEVVVTAYLDPDAADHIPTTADGEIFINGDPPIVTPIPPPPPTPSPTPTYPPMVGGVVAISASETNAGTRTHHALLASGVLLFGLMAYALLCGRVR